MAEDKAHKAQKALAIVAEVISDPDKRRAVAERPEETLSHELRQQGASFDDLPEPVQQFFADLTYEELRVLARLQATMADLPDDFGLTEHLRHGATLAKL
jgi:hypothetical protein